MTYSLDLRKRVVALISGGFSQEEASRTFKISRKTIYNWMSREDLTDPPRKAYVSKLDKAKLKSHVRDYPDALLHERASYFNVNSNTIWYALKRLNIVKKND